ncbi:MAG: DNA/RNA non-specific endonuclease, partial [Xenococcus sp. (in: cyanobacteria)]
MNKLLNQAILILAIILIFSSFIFKPQETTTDKKLEINNTDITNNNPSNANSKSLNNLLIVKEEYVLSYNCSKGIANWVGWRTSESDLGDLSRSNDFREDNSLPKKCYQVDEKDYRGSGYDRGHLMPSGDRTKSKTANSSSFLMVNMIPQHPANNREVWRELEQYSRELVNDGFTLHSFAGGSGTLKTINKGKISVPEHTWKVILVENSETGEVRAIAVIMPNSEKVRKTDWT